MSTPNAKWIDFPKIKIITIEKKVLYVSKNEFIRNLENDDELTNLYGGPRSLLFLCSNNFSFSFELVNTIFPLSDILDLACSLPKSKTSFLSQSIYLGFSKKLHYIQFKIPVCKYEGGFLLNYDFIFQSSFTTKMVLQLFTKTLDIEPNDAFLVNSKSEIFESDFVNFLKSIIDDRIFLVAQLNSKKIKKINERVNTIQEILDSEISYNLRLRKVKDDIIKFFGEYSILDEETQALFELLSESLYKISNEIKDQISLYTSCYMVPVGKIFHKFMDQLPVYHRYTEVLEEAMHSFHKNMEDPLFKTIVSKFQSEPYFESLSIDQYLHEPEQRLPRYRLLIQRVFDATPWGHPDKVLLISVLEKLNNERIKSNDEFLLDQTTLAKYPSDLKQYAEYLPLEEGQGYICNYNVLFEDEKSIAVLYSDYFRIFNIDSTLTKVIEYQTLRILSNEDLVNVNIDTSKECVFIVYNVQYRLKFNSKKDLKEFILNINEASYMTQLKKVNIKVGLFWNNKITECPIHLQNHSMSALNGNIYVFGGINEKGLISSSFVFYSIKDNKWNFYNDLSILPEQRKDSVMITVNDKIYLFGGYSDNMEPLNDLWSFDGENWILIEKSIQLASGGYYSATIFLNSQILLIGGNDKIQTLLYNTTENKWVEICRNSEIPLMKYHNVTFCEQSEIVLLFGGMSVLENEPVKDSYILDLKSDSWIKNSIILAGSFPPPRYANIMISLKSFIFILGGIGSNSPFVLSSTNYFHLIRNEGKFPLFIAFAKACICDDAIWALGGATEDGTSNAFYKITVIRG